VFDTARMIAIASPHVFHEGQQAELCVYIKFQIAGLLRRDLSREPCRLTDALAIDFDKFDMQASHSARVGRMEAERLGAASREVQASKTIKAWRSRLGATVLAYA
jgi:hypothetical protein